MLGLIYRQMLKRVGTKHKRRGEREGRGRGRRGGRAGLRAGGIFIIFYNDTKDH